ncbi:MAG: ABC transporter permease [Bacteroidales bacterium]|nr:ABC transporter permease [Bacteroidales bacterium]
MINSPIIRVALREWKRTTGKRSFRILIFWIPLIVFTILAGIYISGSLRNIPVAVLDQDHSNISRTLIRFVNASPDMHITTRLNSETNLNDYFLHHKEKAVFIIPKGSEKDVIKGTPVNIKVVTNSTNIVYGNILKRNAYKIIETLSGGVLVQKYIAQGLTPKEAMQLTLPIHVNIKPLFNPEYNYLYYLVPGLITVVLQMIMFFLGAGSINKEIKDGTNDELMKAANNKVVSIVFGKLLTYTFIGMIITLFIAILYGLLDIPYRNKITELLLLFFVFILANITIGMALSAVVKDVKVAFDIALFYNSPAFVYSGFTFPVFGMPFIDSVWAQFIPYTHFLHAFFKIYQMGNSFSSVQNEFYVLIVFVITGVLTTVAALKLNKENFPKQKLQILNR